MSEAMSAAEQIAWSLLGDASRLRTLARNLRATNLHVLGEDLKAAANRLERAALKATRETERS